MNGIDDVHYSNKEKIMALARHDPTALAVLRTADFNGEDWTSTLELLVLQLAAEKDALMEQNVKLLEIGVHPRTMYLLPEGMHVA